MKPTVTLGLVPSPGHCQRIASDIAPELPELLRKHVDDQVNWVVAIEADPLTGSDVAVTDLLDQVAIRLQAGDWSYAISLTDLPIRRGDRIVIADISVERSIAYISIPPLGAFRVRSRTKEMVLQLMHELQPHRTASDTYEPTVTDRIAQRVSPPIADTEIDIRFTAPRIRGHTRLLAGMVYANRPWKLIPSFKTTVAAAFATGAYGLIFTTLWELGNAYGIGRLTTLTFGAMTILITWIIVAHRLWEPHHHASSQYLTTLYNSATILTITVAVVFSYALTFLLLLLAAAMYIPTPMLESTLQQSVTPLNYVKIAWVTASVATIAGAVGAGLEDSEAVRNATLGWRQVHRFQQYQQEKRTD